MEAYQNDKSNITEAYGNILIETGNMEKFAESVAMKMLNTCPDIILAIGMQYVDEVDDNEENYDHEEEVPSIIGTIVSVTDNQFIVVEIKETSGKRTKLYWLDYFEGDNIILNALTKKDKNIYIFEYVDIELFDPNIKEYRDYKVLSNVTEAE
ncbi:hypothetical protein NBRC110019_07950 [Neptunitalea chrysea]|uniref:Uncharacterized protein n=1 Tax=Neptunitalea chrysea TaxID=1647581 RepID=A0A9W6EUI2_9FLAO|nr:hypothetical protein [Neptunitalea chrysea]GLB51756.1 hypothetical protein NBRC110019_07950 [Neptunitalea chrysea]